MTQPINVTPAYKEPSFENIDLHQETSGTLPPGRLDTSNEYDQAVRGLAENNLVAYNPATDDAPLWRPLSELIGAATAVPEASFSAPVCSSAWDGSAFPEWQKLYGTTGEPVILTIAGGAGASVVSAEVPLSVDNGGTDASLELNVRLIVDGYILDTLNFTPASASTSGNSVTASFGPATLYFPPIATHSIYFEVIPPSGGAVTIYSTGATIDLSAASTALPVGGDLSGDTDDATVIAIQGTPVSATAPAVDEIIVFDGIEWVPGPVATLQGIPVLSTLPNTAEVLTYNGTAWSPSTVNALNGNPVDAATPTIGDALIWDGGSWTGDPLSGDAAGPLNNTTVARLRGHNISTTAPTLGQALVWNGTAWAPTTTAGLAAKASDLLTRFAPLTNHLGELIVKTNGAVILVEEPNP